MNSSDDDSLAQMEPRSPPDVQDMNDQIKDSINSANGLGIFKKLEICHLTRTCYWQGQNTDGRMGPPDRNSKNLYWWQGAPESRHFKADEIILERAGIRELTYLRGQVTVQPTLSERATGDDADVADLQIVLDTYRREIERKAQYAWALHSVTVEEFGYGIIHTGWTTRQRNDKRQFTVQQILEGLTQSIIGRMGLPTDQQIPPEILAQVEQEAQAQVDLMLSGGADDDAVAFLITLDPVCSPQEAKRALKALQKGKEAIYYAPVDDGGIPVPMALIPWVNVVHPASLTGDGTSDWFGIPEWIGEPELLSRGYKKDFVDKVIEGQANKLMPELLGSIINNYMWVLGGAGIGLYIDQNYLQQDTPMYQLMNIYRTAVESRGLKMVFHTVIHPALNDVYGLHECTGLKELPFQVDVSEPVINAMLSRGVGQIVIAEQNQVIDLLNGEGARAQLGSNPPLLRGVDQHVVVKPGMQMHVRQAGVKPVNEFMVTPKVDQGTLELIALQDKFIDARYFRGEFVDPDTKAQQRELLAHRAMCSLSAFWTMIAAVIDGNTEDLDFSKVHVEVGFNVAGLGDASMERWMGVLEKLAGLDRGGVIDWNVIIQDIITTTNPALAKRAILPSQVAAQRIAEDQNNRIAQMAAGVPVQYPERQSNPQLRQQVMQQWTQYPGNIQKTTQDPDIADLFIKEQEYLTNQITQYQDNPIVGRTLQKPNTDQPQP